MPNKVINVTETDPIYSALVEKLTGATDDKLIIVARGFDNRKDDKIPPVAIKNGIFFYVAYDLGDALAFPPEYTTEQIYIAKANTARRARIVSAAEMFGSGYDSVDPTFPDGCPIDDYEYDGEPMIIVTLDAKSKGAGILLCSDCMKALKEKIGDFLIAPSSIHEIIITPASAGTDILDLSAMVREINASPVVDPDDILGNRAYYAEEWIDD